ncbi:MAG: glycoside hydrolase family 3 protein, partial [Aurantibacter sp.]
MRTYLVLPIIFLTLLCARAQSDPLVAKDSTAQQKWVDSRYESMSLEEKIGQLFMVMVASDQDRAKTDKIKALIQDHKIGGVIFSTGGPLRQAKLANEYQEASKTPLLIGMDAEWGLAMRLDSTYAFPWNMTLGAIKDSSVVKKIGKRIGEHAKRLGVHINFAPVVDINTNPKNPIIGNRSFGEDRENVAKMGVAFIKGMESAGILSSGKHFPGHGDTATDSHHALPVIDFPRERLDSLELYPYEKVIDAG